MPKSSQRKRPASATTKLVASYRFLLAHEKAKTAFSVPDVVTEVGWKVATVRSYISKKWGRFISKSVAGYAVNGVSAFREDEYVRLMSQKGKSPG